MKTRILMLALVLTLALAMTTVASAAGIPTTVPEANRTAGITFTPPSGGGGGDEGVFDPANPPGDVGTHSLQSMAIQFGTHEANLVTRTYNSVTGQLSTTANDSAPVSPPVGGAGETNGRLGILVLSQSTNWSVTATVNPFTIDDNGTPATVMTGFSFWLRENNLAGSRFTPTPGTTLTIPALSANIAGTPGTVASSANMGVFGTNFEAVLTVIGGTSPMDDSAQAVMDWHFIVAP